MASSFNLREDVKVTEKNAEATNVSTSRQFMFLEFIYQQQNLWLQKQHRLNIECFSLHPTMIFEKYFGLTGHNDSNISHEKIQEIIQFLKKKIFLDSGGPNILIAMVAGCGLDSMLLRVTTTYFCLLYLQFKGKITTKKKKSKTKLNKI